MLNTAIIMGRLTRDPEMRRTNSGKPVVSFTVAVDRDYAPDGGERETDFLDIVAWQGTAEFVGKYFKKGSMIALKGRIQKRGWTDKDGNKRSTVEIVADQVYFGESKKDAQQPQNGGNYQMPGTPSGNANGYPGGGYVPQGGAQGYNPNSYERQVNAPPQYNQQGFGGYQGHGYPQQNYQPPFPQQGSYAPIEADDAQLPF